MYILYENGERIILIKTQERMIYLKNFNTKKEPKYDSAWFVCQRKWVIVDAWNGPGLSHKRPLVYILDRMNILFETGWLSKVNTFRKSSE